MALPWRLHDESLPDGVGQVLFQETPDVIVLTQINSGHLITNRLSPALAAIVPVVDASEHGGDGFNARRADIRIAAANKTAIADTLLMLQQPIARLRSLAPSVLQSNDPRVHLLARLFVRDRGLEPRRDPNSRETVVYADESSISCVQHHAEDLVQLGLLERQFFDKLINCPRVNRPAFLCASDALRVAAPTSSKNPSSIICAARIRLPNTSSVAAAS
ncbi:MAG: hypothetical protein ACXWVA_03190 [Rhodoplanes sp.]